MITAQHLCTLKKKLVSVLSSLVLDSFLYQYMLTSFSLTFYVEQLCCSHFISFPVFRMSLCANFIPIRFIEQKIYQYHVSYR